MSTRTAAPALAEALDALPLPFSLFDPEQRLVFCNRALLAAAGLDPQRVRPGMPLLDLVRLIAFQGSYGPGDPERLAEAHAAIDRTRPLRRLVRAMDGRVSETYSVPLATGGFATIAAEVTGFVLAQSEAAREAHRLLGVLARSRTGIGQFDAAGRLTLRNAAFDALIGAPPGLLREGITLAEITKEMAARGEYAMQPPGWAEQVQSRDRRVLQRTRRQRPSGEQIEIVSTPEPGGGFLTEVSDITALAAAEAEAQRRAGLLQGILDTVPIGISLSDGSGRLVACNGVAERFAGLTPGHEHRGRHFDDIVAEQLRNGEFAADPVTFARLAELRAAARSEPLRYRRTRPDGTVLDVVSRPMPGGGWVTCKTDVTPLVAAEAEARRRAATQQVMLETIHHGIVLYGPDHRVLASNRLGAELAGLTPEELRPGTTLREVTERLLQAGAYGEGEAAERQRAASQARDRTRPHRASRRNAAGRALDILSLPTADGGFVVTLSDVTPLLDAEQAARREAAMRALMLETMRHGLVLYDAEGRIVAANALAGELVQTAPGLLRPGATMEEVVRAQHAAGVLGAGRPVEEALAFIRSIDRRRPFRYARERTDGRIIEFVSEPVPDGGFVVSITDVTERVRAEEMARREAELGQLMLDTMRHGIALYDPEQRLIRANRLAATLSGTPDGLLRPGVPFAEVLRAQAAAGELGAASEAEPWIVRMLGLDRTRPQRYTRRRPDGSALEYISEPVAQGGFVVTVTDVTARLRAEAEATRQAGLLATMLGTTRHGVTLHDRDSRLIAANPLAERLFGLAPGTLRPGMLQREIGEQQAAAGEFGPPEEAAAFLASRGTLDRTKPHRYLRRRPDGTALEIASDPTPDGGFVVTATDVTELLATRADAEAQARTLDVLLRSMRHGIVLYGPDRRVIACNALAGEQLRIADPVSLIGETLEQNLRRQAAAGEFGPPAEAAEWLARLATLDRAAPQRYRRRRPNGRVIEFTSDPTPDGGFVVTGTDVTPLFAAQDELSRRAEMQRAMLDNTRHGITLYDAEGRLLAANALAAELTGLPPDALAPGRTLEQIRALQRERGEFGAAAQAERWTAGSMAGAAPRDGTYVRERPDGSVLEVITRVLPGGGFVRSYTDITQLKRAEEAARRQAAVQRAMLDNTRHGIALFDAERRLIAVNPLVAGMTGLAAEDLRPGVTQAELIAKQAAAGEFAGEDSPQDALSGERIASIEGGRYVRRRPNGRMIEVVTQPTPDGGLVRSFTDVTEDRAIREELMRARDAAEEASRVKSRFLANMTHELRTPLNAVIGFASLLRSGARPEETGEFASQIEEAGRHLLGLIDDVLEAARSGSGLAEAQNLPIDAVAVAESAVGLMRAEAEAAGVRLGFATAHDLPQVLGDATRLRQVLLNLLGNAIKFSAAGGQVCVSLRRGEGGVAILIADSGIGIAEADIARAFEPFTQLDNALGRRFPGSGLGLHLARTLCEAMGMRLSLASTQGEGTIAAVHIPKERLAPPERPPA